MSALGHWLPRRLRPVVSALSLKAAAAFADLSVRYRPKADINGERSSPLWEHIAQNICYISRRSRKTATDGENLTTGCFWM
jgi:hypothetical protein